MQQRNNLSEWVDLLPQVVAKWNQTWTRVLKTTPFKMFFGRSVNYNDFEEQEEIEEEQENEEIDEDRNNLDDLDFLLEASNGCDDEAVDNELLVLYTRLNPQALAIATRNLRLEKVPDWIGKMKAGEGVFQIVEVLKQFKVGGDEEDDGLQVEAGHFICWSLSHATDRCGNTLSSIRFRVPFFVNYLKNRMTEKEIWEAKLRMHAKPEVGNFVVIPISKVDRTGTDPRNCIAKVMKIENNSATIGTRAGTIDVPFQLTELFLYRGSQINVENFEVPNKLVKLIAAIRCETSYHSVCKCVAGCHDNLCPCRRNGFNCATKCHPLVQCENKNAINNATNIPTNGGLDVEDESDGPKGCRCKSSCKPTTKRCPCRNEKRKCGRNCACQDTGCQNMN